MKYILYSLSLLTIVLLISAAAFREFVWYSWEERGVVGTWVDPDGRSSVVVFETGGCGDNGRLGVIERRDEILLSVKFRHKLIESCLLKTGRGSVRVEFSSPVASRRILDVEGQAVKIFESIPAARKSPIEVRMD